MFIFLGHREDIPRFLPHIDVLWSTSGFEGQSNAILEAMAWGRPVVATDIPGTRDLIVHGQTGLLFPVGDRTALARWTQHLLEDPAVAARVGNAARNGWQKQFSLKRMIQACEKLYEQLAEQEGHCPSHQVGGSRSSPNQHLRESNYPQIVLALALDLKRIHYQTNKFSCYKPHLG